MKEMLTCRLPSGKDGVVIVRLVPESGKVEWKGQPEGVWYPLADSVEVAIHWLTEIMRHTTSTLRFEKWELTKHETRWRENAD